VIVGCVAAAPFLGVVVPHISASHSRECEAPKSGRVAERHRSCVWFMSYIDTNDTRVCDVLGRWAAWSATGMPT
jgi:hypothetical protein